MYITYEYFTYSKVVSRQTRIFTHAGHDHGKNISSLKELRNSVGKITSHLHIMVVLKFYTFLTSNFPDFFFVCLNFWRLKPSAAVRFLNCLSCLHVKGAVSRQACSFCLILPITRPKSLRNLKQTKKLHGNNKIIDWRQTNMSSEHYF